MHVTPSPSEKPIITLDLAMVECLLDGEVVETEKFVIVPADDLIEAHQRSVHFHELRTPEPEFHL